MSMPIKDYKVERLYGEKYNKNNKYNFLLYNLSDIRLISNQNIFGIGASAFLDNKADIANHYTLPIKLLLEYPSYVKIYKDDNLVSALQYGAGWHYLDTSRLPDGYYHIDIEVVDFRGIVDAERRLFIKSSRLPPNDMHMWQLDIGLLNASFTESRLQVSDDVLIRAGDRFKISQNQAVGLQLLHDSKKFFIEQQYDYYGKHIFFSSALLLSSSSDIVTQLSLSYSGFHLSGILDWQLSKLSGADSPLIDINSLARESIDSRISYSLSPAVKMGLRVAGKTDQYGSTERSYTFDLDFNIFKNSNLRVTSGLRYGKMREVEESYDLWKGDINLAYSVNEHARFSYFSWEQEANQERESYRQHRLDGHYLYGHNKFQYYLEDAVSGQEAMRQASLDIRIIISICSISISR